MERVAERESHPEPGTAAVEAAMEVVAKRVDHLQDDPVFPLNLFTPLAEFVAERLPWLAVCPGSALIHLLTIEMLPVYFFYFCMLSLVKSISAAAQVEGRLKKEGVVLPDGAPADVVEKCLTEYSNHLVWQFSTQNNVVECIHGREVADDLDPRNMMFAVMNFATLGLCFVFVAYFLGMFLINGGLTWPCASGKYLKFIFELRRRKLYRYIAGALVCLAATFVITGAASAFMGDMLVWMLQTILPSALVALITMRVFVAPSRPKFDYVKESFSDIRFKRGSFFVTSSGFATKLNTALIQSIRGHSLSLEDMLEEPDQWKSVRDILISKRAADLENQPAPGPEAVADAMEVVAKGVDDLQDDPLFPLNLLAPLVEFVANRLPWLASCPGSALIHLLTIEMVPVYFFYFCVLSLVKSISAGAQKEASLEGVVLPDGAPADVVEKCLTEYSNHLVWQFSTQNNVVECIHGREVADDLDPRNMMFAVMNFATLGLCFVFVAYFLGMFLINGGLTWPCASGKYLKFIFELRRRKLYRYIAVVFVCLAVIFVISGVVCSFMADMLVWMLQTTLPTGVMSLITMRVFVAPSRPKFDYAKESFSDIRFTRGSFFVTSSGFSTKLNTALIQSIRGHSLSLEDLLEEPDQWKSVQDILISKQAADLENQPKPGPEAVADAMEVVAKGVDDLQELVGQTASV